MTAWTPVLLTPEVEVVYVAGWGLTWLPVLGQWCFEAFFGDPHELLSARETNR